MIDTIASVLEMAKKAADYQTLREQYYATKLLNIISDSRETIPAVLAIFYLA
jgi:ADP-ribosylglycohydrolase